MNMVKQIFLSLSLVFMTAAAPLSAMEQELPTRETLQQWLISDEVLDEKDAINAMTHATDAQVSALGEKYTRLMIAQEGDLYVDEKTIFDIKEEICADIAAIRDQMLSAPQLLAISEETNEVVHCANEPYESSLWDTIRFDVIPELGNMFTNSVDYLTTLAEPMRDMINNTIKSVVLGKKASKDQVKESTELVPAPKQNVSLESFSPEVIRFGQLIDHAMEITSEVDNRVIVGTRNIFTAEDGTTLTEDIYADELEEELPKIEIPINREVPVEVGPKAPINPEAPVENPFVNNPPVIEVPVEVGPKAPINPEAPVELEAPINPEVPVELNDPANAEAPVDSGATETNLFAAFNTKPLIFGFVGVCGLGVLWKLYKSSSYYQCSLLKSWQKKVAVAIENIGSKDSNNVQLPAIELSQLTRLNDAEREQLAQAHNALLVAFTKAQNTVATHATTPNRGHVDIDQTPVIKELQVTHAQWDGLMNDCKNSVEKSSMRFW